MKEKLVGTWKKEDDYRGHSRINHYHWTTEIQCRVCDYSEERKLGATVNGKPFPEYIETFEILEINYKGDVIYRHRYTDRADANKCFLALMKNIGGFKKSAGK